MLEPHLMQFECKGQDSPVLMADGMGQQGSRCYGNSPKKCNDLDGETRRAPVLEVQISCRSAAQRLTSVTI